MDSNIVDSLAASAVQRLLREMQRYAPYMAQQAEIWLKDLARSDAPENYFKHPLAFPMLQMPLWVENTLSDAPDLTFQGDLVYSSVCGYYFVRMIDNLMDGHSTNELKLLPILGFFHMQYYSVYQCYFGVDHPFWEHLKRVEMQWAELSMRDSALTDIDLKTFTAIAGQKVCGGKIPLFAVCTRYQRTDLYEHWDKFFEQLGCWHQMLNDLLSWIKDIPLGTPTYFLSEGNRRKAADETLVGWILREGYDWAVADLTTRLSEIKQTAQLLGSETVITYLNMRGELLNQQTVELRSAMNNVKAIFGLKSV